ncbi:MAG TPA: OmpA family protein [Burkholderiaceae bacterium]|jgi:outer membrane protein OmpA-like peptidoglycan-associated protein
MKAAALLLTLLGLASCAVPPPTDPNQPQPAPAPAAEPAAPAPAPLPPPPPPPPPLPPLLPHAEAVVNAANLLFEKANLGDQDNKSARRMVLIDPLIDGVTRQQTKATAAMESRIVALAKSSYPKFDVKPFNAVNLAQSPLLVVGTFTPINQQGKSEGDRESYRFCLVMVDLKSGKLVSKAVMRSRMDNVDAAPLPFFADAPGWSRDPAAEGYVKTCQASKPGDAIQPSYVEALVASSLIDEGIRAYNARRYREALVLFTKAQASSGGQQLRVLTGLYLTHIKLGMRDAAAKSFGQLVDYGIAQGMLAMQFTFANGASVLPADTVSTPYGMWLRTIAKKLNDQKLCAEVGGHASHGGPEAVNDRLSSLRAEYVRQRLLDEAPTLTKRLIAAGYGSRANLVGTGRDDASDQLDRRVELKLLACGT